MSTPTDQPPTTRAERRRASAKTGRVRGLAALVVLVWLALAGIGGPLVGRLSEVQKNENSAFLPSDAESKRVLEQSGAFASESVLPLLVLVESDSWLTPEDRAAVADFAAKLPNRAVDIGGPSTVGAYLSGAPPTAVPSEDGLAMLVVVSLSASEVIEAVDGTAPLKPLVAAVQESIDEDLRSQGLTVYVTGPAGFINDLVAAFAGIDGLLLGVALAVVLVILLVVYRSPLLPFAVLASALFALAAAATIVYPLAKAEIISLSGQSQGILFILVVGAATDYALLMVSRFKEELHDHEQSWVAMRQAWRGSVSAILASGFTVIIGLLCLLLSVLGSTKGLGPVGALGIAGAMLSVLTFLPAVLVLGGRRLFWPSVPRVDHVHRDAQLSERRGWGRVAHLVGTHPRRAWGITLICLLAAAAFLPTLKADGISQSDTFLTSVESVDGQEALGRHFPAGSGSPVQILAPAGEADAVVAMLNDESGVSGAFVGPAPGAPPKVVDGQVLIQATLDESADSPEAADVVQRLRTDLAEISPDILVGGSTAQNLDVRAGNDRDLAVIIPAIIAVVFLVLALLLRSLAAAVMLVLVNILSFAATLGISAIAFNHIFGFPGADPSTALYGFVFLVALGVDYSIFLMTRAREETPRLGSRRGMLTALTVTGGVITSAGLVLASTFGALAVLPLLFLAQIAFIVAFGVLLDTLVVRSLLVPALTVDIGPKIWWPGSLSRLPDPPAGVTPAGDVGSSPEAPVR